MKHILALLTFLTLPFLFISCSSSEYITPVSSVRRDPQQEISDAEILKAFATKPQLVKPLTIALYGGGASIKGFADSLKKLPQVKDVFEISPGLIESDKYYQRRSNYWSEYYYEPEAINISQLRLAAAQAKCDLLIYCGAFHKYSQKSNFLAYSYIFLITAAIVPGQDAELVTCADMFCIDVRNGFLYGSYTDQEVYKENYVSLRFNDQLDKLKDTQTDKLVPRLANYVKELLSRDEIYLKK